MHKTSEERTLATTKSVYTRFARKRQRSPANDTMVDEMRCNGSSDLLLAAAFREGLRIHRCTPPLRTSDDQSIDRSLDYMMCTHHSSLGFRLRWSGMCVSVGAVIYVGCCYGQTTSINFHFSHFNEVQRY